MVKTEPGPGRVPLAASAAAGVFSDSAAAAPASDRPSVRSIVSDAPLSCGGMMMRTLAILAVSNFSGADLMVALGLPPGFVLKMSG